MPLGHSVDDLFAEAGFTRAEVAASVRQQAQERWEHARAAYDQAPQDFYTCWCYLAEHPIFQDTDLGSLFERELYVHPAKVNPETREIDSDDSKNTRLEIWLEHGPVWRKDDAPEGFWTQDLEQYSPFGYTHTHDPDLDCGGETFEQAICTLARLVRQEFGDDRSRVYLSDDPWDQDDDEDDDDDDEDDEDDEDEEEEEDT